MTVPSNDAEVPAFWRSLGLPGIVDLHVHFLPPRLLRRIWSDEDEAAISNPWPVLYKWSDEERLDHLRAMGVRAFTALAFAHRPGMAADLNSWTLDFAAHTPGCLPTATFFPESGVNRYTRAALEAGARLFKVHLQAGDFNPAHARLDAVWGDLADAGIPVVVHAGSSPVAGPHTGPGPIEAVLRRHPRLTAVIAHLGAPEYAGFLDLTDRYERVCLDTSLSFTACAERSWPYPRALLPRLCDLAAAGRVLLGTDYPNLPHPYAGQLSALVALDLDPAVLRAICWYNASALLRLEPDDLAPAPAS